jgi:HEAT repeat protein
MRPQALVLALAGLVPLLLAEPAAGRCPPSFRGPGGAVPPGLREPENAPPPTGEEPPPPTTETEAPPPTTGTTPTPSAPATTPTPPVSGPATPGAGPERRAPSRDNTTWETWWELNKIEFFPRRFVAPPISKEGPVSALPTPLDGAVVQEKIWPTLHKVAQESVLAVQEAAIITLARVAQTEEQKAVARELLTKAVVDHTHHGAHAAAIGLSYVADATSIHPLYLAAREEKVEDEVKAFVALTMTTIGHPMASTLLKQLGDIRGGYFELVGAALMALGYNSVEQDGWIPEFLEQVYEDPKARTAYRALAVESFGRIGRVDLGAKILCRAMGDKESEVRRSAALALGVLDWRTDAEREIAAIKTPYEAWVDIALSAEDAAKIAALEAAVPAQRVAMEKAVREAVKTLAVALEKDSDGFVRNMCAISLGRIARDTRYDAAVKVLEKDLAEDRLTIREFEILALAIAKASSAHAAAQAAITGKNRADTTRAAGCVALGLLGDPKADALLVETIAKDPHPFVRGYAALALGMIGSPGSADVILTLVQTTRTPTARAFGALGLGLLGTKQGSQVLIDLLGSGEMENPVVLSHVVYGLGLTKDRSGVDGLVKLAGDASVSTPIRRAAITAIGYLATGEFFPRRHLMSRGHNYMLGMQYIGSYFYTL